MSAPKNRAARARAAAEHRTAAAEQKRRSPLPWIVLGVVVVAAVGIALLVANDDDDDTVATGGETTGEDGGEPGVVLETAGVTVTGDPLPPRPDSGADPAAGTTAPSLEGVSTNGTPTMVSPTGEPTVIAFMAHWCPHCQRELPELVEAADSGDLDDVRSVVVLTGTQSNAPNYPPSAWIQDEGWEGEVLVDDERGSAAEAFGLTSYPYLVVLDGDGEVVARAAGAIGRSGIEALIAQVG